MTTSEQNARISLQQEMASKTGERAEQGAGGRGRMSRREDATDREERRGEGACVGTLAVLRTKSAMTLSCSPPRLPDPAAGGRNNDQQRDPRARRKE